MGTSAGKHLNVIFDTSQAGVGPIATGNNNLISMSFTLADMTKASVQIITDGGAKVNYMFQVTDLPTSIVQYNRTIFGATMRDDSYTSPHWSTITTSGQLTSTTPSTIITLAESCHVDGRLLFNWDSSNTAGTTAKIFAVCKTLSFGH